MALMNRFSVAAISAALCAMVSAPLMADIWVFEPSLTLDQRFDDNYFLQTDGGALSATRGVAEVGVSREASDYALKGLARVDGLFTANTDVGREDLTSNYIFAIDARRRTARSRYGVRVNYKQDTPSRDIAADISDNNAIAEDTSLLITQSLSSNVARDEYLVEPNFEYDYTRRLQFNISGSLSEVSHELPSTQDAIYQYYLNQLKPEGYPNVVDRQGDGTFREEPLPYDAVTTDNIIGGVFNPADELDDYREVELQLGTRFKLSPISTLTAIVSYSRFTSQVLPNPLAFFTSQQTTPDENSNDVRRKPRRERISTTNKFTLGYERLLTPTLRFIVNGGVYTTTTDNSDTFRADDVTSNPVLLPRPDVGEEVEEGWLASISLAHDAGATRYSARYAVDVVPSSAGSQVETNQLTGEVRRTLSPRLNVSFRGRAFEPDRLGVEANDAFSRRFISFEPGVQWKYSRNWTATAAYRYRRQKARVALEPSESNAILLAIKYTPPSEVRDTARANGL